jgi:DNA-binding winged helix-turn-helix (wHTH) protein/tetratricopeptide (TPR) repeat protein
VSAPLRFGEFELDEANASLTRAGAAIALTPKAFALLCALVQQPGRLADKNALLDAVWGHRHVSESVLKTTVSQVRSALGDDAGEPRFIETVSRRGYRFIGEVVVPNEAAAHRAALAPLADESAVTLTPMVGRAAVFERLRSGWQRALAGQRQLFWVAGDAGVGKTTLIDRLAADVGSPFVTRGQCVEQFGAGEPYLPIFDALKVLCRRNSGLAATMRSVAPTWLVQMPWLTAESERAALQLELAGAGQERMVRELIELIDHYSLGTPLLLITEDLHWADDATLRLMEHFARYRSRLHVMWIATFRLTQVIAEDHPLKSLRQELQLHRLAEELLLDPFSEHEVGEYVRTRLPEAALPEDAIRRLHAHTDGLPLFVANVMDDLFPERSGTAPTGADGAALLGRALPVPSNLTGAIEKQLTKLPADVRGMLEAASVCGVEFSARRVAELLEHDADEVGRCCDELVRGKYWLADAGIDDLPTGEVDTRYAFRHALYKHTLYQRIPGARRVTYHRCIARALSRDRGESGAATAAELASHFELGHEHVAAVARYVEAAESALSRFAPREAIELTAHALTLLPRCPEGPARLELELGLLAHRGIACAHVFGVSSPGSVAAFERVREICGLLPATPARAILMNGLAWGLFTRGEYAEAIALATRVHDLAERADDFALMAHSSGLLGVTYAVEGEHAAACTWFERGLAICEQHGDALPGPSVLLDPEISMRANLGGALVVLGRVDRAREHLAKAFARCETIRQPMARMVALWGGCTVAMLTDDVDAVAGYADGLARLVTEHGVRQALGPSLWMRGWVEMQRGEHDVGYAHIMEGFASHERLGMLGGLPIVLGLAAEALRRAGRWEEAEQKSAASLELVERLGERGMLPLLLTIRSQVADGLGDEATAEQSLAAALAEARAQQAPGAELMVRIALAERGDADALPGLEAAYDAVTEGRDTPLAARARRVLEQRPATES